MGAWRVVLFLIKYLSRKREVTLTPLALPQPWHITGFTIMMLSCKSMNHSSFFFAQYEPWVHFFRSDEQVKTKSLAFNQRIMVLWYRNNTEKHERFSIGGVPWPQGSIRVFHHHYPCKSCFPQQRGRRGKGEGLSTPSSHNPTVIQKEVVFPFCTMHRRPKKKTQWGELNVGLQKFIAIEEQRKIKTRAREQYK